MPACVHPVADQRIVATYAAMRSHIGSGLHAVSVTLRCRECGELTTITTPRTDRPGTDASNEQSEDSHA